jgi:predicted transcriptional regulator
MTLVKRLLPQALGRLVTTTTEAPLIEAARLLRAGTDIVVVCEPHGLLVGVITKTDVVGQMSQCQGASCVTRAALVMTPSVVVCRPDQSLKEVWSTMTERGVKNVPVTDSDSRPLGVLNARDVLQALLNEVENEKTLLRDYVMNVGYQ